MCTPSSAPQAQPHRTGADPCWGALSISTAGRVWACPGPCASPFRIQNEIAVWIRWGACEHTRRSFLEVVLRIECVVKLLTARVRNLDSFFCYSRFSWLLVNYRLVDSSRIVNIGYIPQGNNFFYRVMHFSAKRGIAIVIMSVCLLRS